MLPRIKKIKNSEFVKTTNYDYWVKDFTKNGSSIDINSTITEQEYFVFLENELKNNFQRYNWFDPSEFYYRSAIIISDGFDFNEIHKILRRKKDVCILGVNNVLNKWRNEECEPNFYVVNNPYEDCLKFLPKKRNLPRCIASNRTNSQFLDRYGGMIYRYSSASEEKVNFNKTSDASFQVEDYRNPVCAAINISFKIGCENILLLCNDNSFPENRPGSVLLDNNFYCYPQQNFATEIIDSCFYWLKKNKNNIFYNSKSKKMESAVYIESDKIKDLIDEL
jgi:hypothetical protein